MTAPQTPPPAIEALLTECQTDAATVTRRHQKGSSVRLYAVLVKAMAICERCLYSDEDRLTVERLFHAQPKTGNRRYVERGSDVYSFVCRYVFNSTDLATASRYAHTLREAGRRQLTSRTLFEHLRDKGGVNALFLCRPLDRTFVEAKTIRLDQPVRFQKDSPTTLKLARLVDGVFKVLEVSHG